MNKKELMKLLRTKMNFKEFWVDEIKSPNMFDGFQYMVGLRLECDSEIDLYTNKEIHDMLKENNLEFRTCSKNLLYVKEK